MINVAIVEDNRGTRESLSELLNRAPGLCCIGAHPTGEAALRSLPAESPDVVLMDINLPGMSGIECVAKLKSEMPGLHILMLTMYEQSDLIFNSLRAGASGYLLKPFQSVELISKIQDLIAPQQNQCLLKCAA